MSKQSKELSEFYQAYASWLRIGAPISHYFSRGKGLCGNIHRFGEAKRMLGTQIYEIEDEMSRQFLEADLSPTFPFNRMRIDGSHAGYWAECNSLTAHLNPERIAWVNAHCDPERE